MSEGHHQQSYGGGNRRGRGRRGGHGGRGSGGRGGRGGGGYDWTRHLPPDHPMRRGLGPDPRRGGGGGGGSTLKTGDSSSGVSEDSVVVAAEYESYYVRRDSRRRERNDRDRLEFDRVVAHAAEEEEAERRRRLEEDEARRGAEGADDMSAAGNAARRVVSAMTEEEREAALARHEARRAGSHRYAVDLEPEGLHLSNTIGMELTRAVDEVKRARGSQRSSGNVDNLDGSQRRSVKKKRSGGGGVESRGTDSASYFRTSSHHVSADTYKNIIENRMNSAGYRRMLKQREKLPAYEMSTTIADALLSSTSSAVLISGETGCGKTTQIPRILIESAALRGMGRLNVVVAQPRRIAAVGVAERVAEEGGTEKSPGEPGCDVGYHVRHDRRVGDDASVVFATTGVVLRILAGDPLLRGVDVVIIDEVHERSSDGDFLVTVLRDLCRGVERGPGSDRPLRLILMSATVDADFFVDYLADDGGHHPGGGRGAIPTIHVEGVAHPVRDYYLEDAVDACVDALRGADDMFELDRRNARGGGGGNRRGRYGRQRSNTGGPDRSRMSEDEENVRSRRREYVERRRGKNDRRTADLVTDFDVGARISEREGHMKSVSSGDLPLGLAYHLVFFLDGRHRPHDGGDGAILVFLPGFDDIAKLSDAFEGTATHDGPHADQMSNLHVLTLHGSMPTSEQREVFRRPPGRKRKVVLSTNVAESSITIDDVVYCLDLGKHKEKTYDPRSHIECLLPTWISKASARQRRGRAGRVRPGECWHLYPSWYLHDGEGVAPAPSSDGAGDVGGGGATVPGGDVDPRPAFEGDVKLRAFALPEMIRTPLEDVALRARHLGLAPPGRGGVERFLSRCPSPPGPLSLHNAMEALGASDMGLLHAESEELTPLGRAVASIPVPPRFGLALMLADHLGCEGEMLTICALLSGRTPFYAPIQRKVEADRAKRAFAEDVPSDLYAVVRAYRAWERAERSHDGWSFCRTNYISRQAMLTARANRGQLARDLEDSKREIFATRDGRKTVFAERNRSEVVDDEDILWRRWGRVMGVLAASFGSHLARLDHGGTGKCRCPIYTKSHGRVKLFPSSISSPDGAAKDVAARGTTYYVHRWGIYMEKVRNAGGICLYDINEVSPLAVSVCASGERMYSERESSLVAVDANDGKVMWSDDEVHAMESRREELSLLAVDKNVADVERVGARVEVEDIETRMGIMDLIGKDAGSSRDSVDVDTRVLNFVVSALEKNGGTYPMSQLRRMMKADMDLYNAMGPVRSFAAKHSSIVSLEKLGGRWMFVLQPGAKESLRNGAPTCGTSGQGSNAPFYGPKQWVYFDMNDAERECIGNVRRTFREIIDTSCSGRPLIPEEEGFLDTLGWALTEEWTKNNS